MLRQMEEEQIEALALAAVNQCVLISAESEGGDVDAGGLGPSAFSVIREPSDRDNDGLNGPGGNDLGGSQNTSVGAGEGKDDKTEFQRVNSRNLEIA